MAFIEVGRIVGSHGVRGAVKVAPHSGTAEGLLGAKVLEVAGPASGSTKRYEVRTAMRSGRTAVFLLAGIDTIEGAMSLKGSVVSVRREDFPEADEGEFYAVDLVGAEVFDEAGALLGAVADYEEGPGHDWLVVRFADDGRDSLLPVVAELVLSISSDAKRIVVADPERWRV